MAEAASRYPGSADIQSNYSGALAVWKTSLTNAQKLDEAEKVWRKAIEAIELALRLDPLSLSVMQIHGGILLREGDCPGLQRLLDRALDMDPAVGRFRFMLASCLHIFEGDKERALSLVENEPVAYLRDTLSAILYHQLGDPESAKSNLDSLLESNGDSASYQYGQVYSQWGEIDKALEWLEKAIEIHDPGIILSAGDPYLNPLRGEPRFQGVLRAAGY